MDEAFLDTMPPMESYSVDLGEAGTESDWILEAVDCRKNFVKCDVLVIGSGIAGLYAALKASKYGRVVMLTKGVFDESSTYYAQGGIAAAICKQDSPELHYRDTVAAGDALCDPDSVRLLVNEGIECVLDLLRLGVAFDRVGDELALTREGAHSRRRILHAYGDATGRAIAEALLKQVRSNPDIIVKEKAFLSDLIVEDGVCRGVYFYDGKSGDISGCLAEATILSTGGAGQLYKYTTNPISSTGDGMAIAFRAGASMIDMEFMQFHPTALHIPGKERAFLISEAVRGEGAFLVNSRGESFMSRYHELKDLAPRDVVSRAIVSEMKCLGDQEVFLDFTGWSEERIRERFPTIFATCLEHGWNLSRDRIPVAPAAHYTMGGIMTDLNARTTIPRLYACGEVACTGVHGANRLASNSLVEAIVFAKRAVNDIERSPAATFSGPLPDSESIEGRDLCGLSGAEGLKEENPERDKEKDSVYDSPDALRERVDRVRDIMWEDVGIIRNRHGLKRAAAELNDVWAKNIRSRRSPRCSSIVRVEGRELSNMILVGRLMIEAALIREESRGAHFREDYPERNDALWRKRIVLKRRV